MVSTKEIENMHLSTVIQHRIMYMKIVALRNIHQRLSILLCFHFFFR